ncbi:MAG TPA: hypothetical protein VF765_29040 [Polyangiaceae bacterium]
MRSLPAVLLLLSTACTSGSTGSLPPASAPGPYLLQYVGEYDGPSGANYSRIVLHADGTMEVTGAGQTLQGNFTGSGRAGDATATAQTEDGRTIALSFAATSPTDVPAQVQMTIGAQTLVGPWVAGGESMCDASGGTWRDDDPDPKTGLYCTCSASDVYMPSRGGCVASTAGNADPDRRRLSDSAQDRAGSYEGTGSISSLSLSRDGTYDVTVDGGHDAGTWWDAPSLTGAGPTIDCTGAVHAFRLVFGSDGAVTVNLGSGHTETLRVGR